MAKSGLVSICAVMLALAVGGVPVAAQSKPAAQPSKSATRAANVNELVVSYLAAWNEREPGRRRELIAKTWTDRGGYIDAHRTGDGHDGLDAMIKAAQERFPGYQLRLVSSIEAQHGYLRFSWAGGGTADAPLYLAGTDFVTLAPDGRFQQVAGFTDAAPAPPPAK